MDEIDRSIFNLYKDKAISTSNKNHVYITTIIVAATGLARSIGILLGLIPNNEVNNSTFISTIKEFIFIIIVISIIYWFYYEAKYREYRKKYMTIIVRDMADEMIAKKMTDLDTIIEQIKDKTLFDYSKIKRIIEEKYSIKSEIKKDG